MASDASVHTLFTVFTAKSGLNLVTYKAVDCHNIMGGSAFKVEELKIRTFVFRFLGLVCTSGITFYGSLNFSETHFGNITQQCTYNIGKIF